MNKIYIASIAAARYDPLNDGHTISHRAMLARCASQEEATDLVKAQMDKDFPVGEYIQRSFQEPWELKEEHWRNV